MKDEKKRDYLLPVRVLTAKNALHPEYLTSYRTDQSYFGRGDCCSLAPGGWVLLDFGKEYSGGAKLVVNECGGRKNARLRLRFGESAMEAMSELGYKGSCNDHAMRDETLTVPWVGCLEYGNTGFRFLRVDNVSDIPVSLRQIFAVFIHSGTPKVGRFSCSDARLDRIFDTAAYTVYLTKQDYVYDGVKRDRTVWIGDMHPETSAILRLYGADSSIYRSLELVKGNTPPDRWMNDIPTYTMWWIKIQYDLYLYTGDTAYLTAQADYIEALAPLLLAQVGENGENRVEFRFIDWPSSEDPAAQDAGVRALIAMSFDCAAKILRMGGKSGAAEQFERKLALLAAAPPPIVSNKQAAALLAESGLVPASAVNSAVLSKSGASGLSAFLGYYVLRAMGEAGNVAGALTIVRDYWGAMLDLGATTFWEDFDLAWVPGAKPIDALLACGEYDVHGDNGGYCYKGYRHSLCHGWSSGPASFLLDYVLGVRSLAPGFSRVRLAPCLSGLSFAEGTVQTPLGPLTVSCRLNGGKRVVEYEAPKGMEIVVK